MALSFGRSIVCWPRPGSTRFPLLLRDGEDGGHLRGAFGPPESMASRRFGELAAWAMGAWVALPLE